MSNESQVDSAVDFAFSKEEFRLIQDNRETLSLFQTRLADRIDSLRNAILPEQAVDANGSWDEIIRLTELLGYANLRLEQLPLSSEQEDDTAVMPPDNATERSRLQLPSSLPRRKKSFETYEELVLAVDFYVAKTAVYAEAIALTYGERIGEWDVSKVKSFYSLFGLARLGPTRAVIEFNEDISSWDVSSCVDFSFMFDRNTQFNQDLSKWDVSAATDMHAMFRGATAFTSDLGKWDVSKVKDMTKTFKAAASFNCDLSAWNVSQVTDMKGMFERAKHFQSNLGTWDVSNVIIMEKMFCNAAAFNCDLSNWNVSKVSSMRAMFFEAHAFNGNIMKWDVSSVENFEFMFYGAKSFCCDVSGWNVTKAKNMLAMFQGASVFRCNLEDWQMPKDIWGTTDMFTYAPEMKDCLPSWYEDEEEEDKEPWLPKKKGSKSKSKP